MAAVAVGVSALALAGCDYFEKNTLIGKLLADDEFETVARVEADAYEEASDSYEQLASMPTFVSPETAAAIGDTIVVTAGGGTATFIYDAATNAWSGGPALPAARSSALALVHGTRVVVVSGTLATGLPAATIDLLDTTDVQAGWLSVAIPLVGGVLPAERSEVAAAVAGDLLFLVGGRDRGGLPSRDVTVFDLSTATTTQSFTHALDVLPEPRVLAGAFAVAEPGNGPLRLHVVGGHAGDSVAKATDVRLVPDFALPFHDTTTSTPRGRLDPQVVVGEDEVLVLWSRLRNFGREQEIDLYDVSAGAWTAAPSYPRALTMSTAVFSDGTFRVFGGLSTDESKGDAAELELGATPRWVDLTPGRDRHAAFGLEVDGRPVIFGGVDTHKKAKDLSPL